jgi:hypothetical protein
MGAMIWFLVGTLHKLHNAVQEPDRAIVALPEQPEEYKRFLYLDERPK